MEAATLERVCVFSLSAVLVGADDWQQREGAIPGDGDPKTETTWRPPFATVATQPNEPAIPTIGAARAIASRYCQHSLVCLGIRHRAIVASYESGDGWHSEYGALGSGAIEKL